MKIINDTNADLTLAEKAELSKNSFKHKVITKENLYNNGRKFSGVFYPERNTFHIEKVDRHRKPALKKADPLSALVESGKLTINGTWHYFEGLEKPINGKKAALQYAESL